jgi:phosphonate transport system permease protein
MAIDSVSSTGVVGAKRATPQTIDEKFRQELLSPWPRIGVSTLILSLFIALVYAWGVDGTNASPRELVEGIPNIIDFIVRLFPPDFDLTAVHAPDVPIVKYFASEAEWSMTLPQAVPAIIETIQMAIIGTTLAIVISLPLGLLAARNTSPHPYVYQTIRMILNIVRAVPEIIFALVFVAAVGLGPFGGVMALGIGAAGSLSKLFAEAIESIDPQQVLAIRATGANGLLSFIFGAIPQAAPLAASYSLLYFEHNVRAASILGIVGAGGIGFILNKYLALFQYRNLMGALILLLIAVTIIDRLSDRIRKRLI